MPLAVSKAVVAHPAIGVAFYNGEKLTADVPESGLYTVTANDGGVDPDEYDVVLTLADPANYKWAGADGATLTMKFKIVDKDANVVTVSLEGWTYGEAPKAPVADATFGAETSPTRTQPLRTASSRLTYRPTPAPGT